MQDFKEHKRKFDNFLNGIKGNEKIAIVGHANCLDGTSSAILMHEILRKKYPNLPEIEVHFASYAFGSLDNLTKIFHKKEIEKVFLVDLGVDQSLLDELERMKSKFDVLLIDHHPLNPNLKIDDYIIKTRSFDCTSLVLYLFGEKLVDFKDWTWLSCVAAVSEFSWHSKDNLEFIQKHNPTYSPEDPNSELLNLVKKMNNTVNYYSKDSLKSYQIILEKDFKKIDEISKEVSEELDNKLEDFEKNAERHFNKELYFYSLKSNISIGSNISTVLSLRHKGSTIIIFAEDGNKIKVNARNNGKPTPYSMNELCNAGIAGLENAMAGGHAPASGASVKKKDLETFKRNVIEFVKSKISK
ncbi:DHH family phosphoesterase [Candidatus Pacearchaeota archaeon]|nr:DHH family phosphoesterase [Candidatus Pacearchaeota archaeon]